MLKQQQLSTSTIKYNKTRNGRYNEKEHLYAKRMNTMTRNCSTYM